MVSTYTTTADDLHDARFSSGGKLRENINYSSFVRTSNPDEVICISCIFTLDTVANTLF